MYPIVFSINDEYAQYLYICLQSLLTCVKQNDRYEVYVLYSDLSEEHQKNILQLKHDNFNIKFINVETIIRKYKDNFSLNAHFTIETYYRFFLPQIFTNLDKVLYLDADTMIMKDISPLFNIDINGYYLGVTHDCEIVRASNFIGTKYSNYFIKTLNVDPSNYFQAGVMLVNLRKMREDNITDKLLATLKKVRIPKFVDQDILNIVCQNKVTFIPQNWDYTWHLPFIDDDYLEHISGELALEYQKAKENPYIIHFTGNSMKPVDYPNQPEAKVFWQHVETSPYKKYFEQKLKANIANLYQQLYKKKIKLLKYKMLDKITYGGLKKQFQCRQEKLQRQIIEIHKKIGIGK